MKTVLEYAHGNGTVTEFKITIDGNPRLSEELKAVIRVFMGQGTYHEL